MPKAIGYCRLSVEDSSNSIPNQKKRIEEYCQFNKLELAQIFVDDGKTGWNFDRPGFIEMERYCKANKDVEYLIVPHFDRFSRADPIDAMMKERYIRDKLGVKVLQVSEPVDTDTNSSTYQIVRFMQAFAANEELNRIRDRTRSGMHYINLDGRVANNAPTGYSNGRDPQNKPILIIDNEKAKVIKKIFKTYLSGGSFTDCLRIAKANGLNINGHSSMRRTLSNPIYMGKVRVKEFKGQPEKLVQGLHTPIISEYDYWAAADLMSGKRHTFHGRDEVPLRGSLHCHCGKKMTAGPSKGKSGKIYWYYFCEEHRKANLSAVKLHKSFYDILDLLAFSPSELEEIQLRVTDELNTIFKERGGELMRRRHDLGKVNVQIEAAEERYLLQGDVSEKTYTKVMTSLKAEQHRLERAVLDLEQDSAKYWGRLEKMIAVLSDLKAAFEKMDNTQRARFIGQVFEPNLYYQSGSYRTRNLNALFYSKQLEIKEKGLVEFDQPLSENDSIISSSP